MTPRIRVALIGYGFSGSTFHAPLIRAVPGLELRLIGSSDTAKVHADLPGITVINDPLSAATTPDIDLVVIATPNDSHAPLADAALSAGKHVVVDKPFTLDLTSARALTTTATRHDRLLTVFHNRRWDSDFLTVRQALTDDVIGAVKHFESHFDRFRPQVRDRWREGDGPGSGLWVDLGPHLLDQVLLLFGLPDRVTGNLALLRDGARSDDWAHVVLNYPDKRVVLQASMLVAGGSPRFIVHGTDGSIVKQRGDGQEQQLLAGMTPGGAGWGDDPDPLVVHDGSGGRREIAALPGDQRLFYAGLVAALQGGAPNPVPPVHAIAVMACLDAAAESARTQRSVVPSLTNEERAAWFGG
ncbi:oxidoreductase [Sphingomonas hylomeconis]|uniref:Oxidoreductase n=1 Tax=Sphingomonas hylomeconis TaxID=1395958 RepID=A0ABV7SUM3_9SPHN|nr:oxidoreductase [Sphingomonas hylomeconis]